MNSPSDFEKWLVKEIILKKKSIKKVKASKENWSLDMAYLMALENCYRVYKESVKEK